MSTSASRTREWRRRQANGKVLLAIELDEVPLVAALTDAGLLAIELADQREAIAAATERLINILIHERDVSPH